MTRFSKFSRYGDWLNRWVEIYKKPRLKPASLTPILSVIQNHIPAKVKRTRLCRLTSDVIQEIINDAPPTRTGKYIYDVLNDSLSIAFRNGWLKMDIMVNVSKLFPRNKKSIPLSIEEQSAFLKKIEWHKLEEYFKFLLYTGVRRGEALLLRWRDIDFKNKIISIYGTKTDNAERVIPIFSPIYDDLYYMKRRGEYVFPFNADYVTKSFKKLCPAHHLHELRHTFATNALLSGVPIEVIQSWLGHGSKSMTKTYAKVTQKLSAQEAMKVQKVH